MKFTRDRVIERAATGTLGADGKPYTLPSVASPALSDLILGDGSASKTVFKRTQGFDVSKESESILTTNVDAGVWTDIIQPINGNRQIYLTVNVVDLGAMEGLMCRIEFQDPDHPEFWVPSKDGVNREAAESLHSWTLTQPGSYVLTSRLEHAHFRAFRARFQAVTTSANGDTNVVVSWHHDGKISPIEAFSNDPDAPLI